MNDFLNLFSDNDVNDFLVKSFSANNFCSDSYRRELEQKYIKYLEVTDKFNRKSVSYQLNKKEILHSWLRYKEGFSSQLVEILIHEMNIKKGDVILDPFIGSGTTALVCMLNGINCIGYDIMPLSEVAINAKINVFEYNIEHIKNIIEDISKIEISENNFESTPYIKITQDAYPIDNAKFLKLIFDWNNNSKYSKLEKNLVTLCVLNSLERCSFTSKDGQYLGWDCRSNKVKLANKKRLEQEKPILKEKYVRDKILNSKILILEELNHVLHDIVVIQKYKKNLENVNINFIKNSVLYELPKLEDNSINGVITSPPYCNRYDYTRTYALELVYLGAGEADIKKMRRDLLSCTVESKSKINDIKKYYESIGCIDKYNYIYSKIEENCVFKEILQSLKIRQDNGDLNNTGIIRMVEGYFIELAFIYAELYRVSKSGSYISFVNDNVRYGGEVIPVDFLCTSFAEQFGFKVKKIYTLKQKKVIAVNKWLNLEKLP